MTPVRLFALAVSIGLLVGCGVPVKAPVPASGTIVAASHRDDAE